MYSLQQKLTRDWINKKINPVDHRLLDFSLRMEITSISVKHWSETEAIVKMNMSIQTSEREVTLFFLQCDTCRLMLSLMTSLTRQ